MGQISRDEMVARDEVAEGEGGNSIPQLSPVFENKWSEIAEFSAGCHDACRTMLHWLSEWGRLPIDALDFHRSGEPSDTALKFVSHPSSARVSDVPDNLHTDAGTLTLLFYTEWSIHTFSRQDGIWAFVPPQATCALVNVANSLQKFSGGRFHSPEHRATQPLDGAKDRYFVTYLLRPEDRAIPQLNRDD